MKKKYNFGGGAAPTCGDEKGWGYKFADDICEESGYGRNDESGSGCGTSSGEGYRDGSGFGCGTNNGEVYCDGSDFGCGDGGNAAVIAAD